MPVHNTMTGQDDHQKRDSRRVGGWLLRYGLVGALVAFGGVVAMLHPNFLTAANLLTIIRQSSINGLLAVGVTCVLLTGGVDLSLGSVVALTGVVAAHLAHPGEWPRLVPVTAGVLAGLACGGVNGVLVAWGRVAPFIVTLGMMAVARGLALVLSGGRPVSSLSAEFTWLGSGSFWGFSVPVLLLAGVAGGLQVFLRQFRLGRYVYAVGGNEPAARAAGLPVAGVKTLAYGLCGAMAGLAGVVQAARSTSGQPNAGIAYELDAIAAAVIGGTSLAGGVGGIGGTILGVVFIGVLNNGLDLLNVGSYYQQIIKGVIIVAAVALDRRRTRGEA